MLVSKKTVAERIWLHGYMATWLLGYLATRREREGKGKGRKQLREATTLSHWWHRESKHDPAGTKPG